MNNINKILNIANSRINVITYYITGFNNEHVNRGITANKVKTCNLGPIYHSIPFI